jgi:molybdate transport system ATP-binding protein
MTLNIDRKKRLRHFDLNRSFRVPEHELHALIGHCGAGKTPILRIIAGLDKPDEGFITCGLEVWYDSLAGTNLPVQKRGLGDVFQEDRAFWTMPLLPARTQENRHRRR